MTTFDEFKQCVQIQAGLDMEALDVAFIQPLKDLTAWWDRQSEPTRRYVQFFFGSGLAAESIKKFFNRLLGAPAAVAVEALGAVIVGIGLGLFLAILGDCGLQAVDG